MHQNLSVTISAFAICDLESSWALWQSLGFNMKTREVVCCAASVTLASVSAHRGDDQPAFIQQGKNYAPVTWK